MLPGLFSIFFVTVFIVSNHVPFQAMSCELWIGKYNYLSQTWNKEARKGLPWQSSG